MPLNILTFGRVRSLWLSFVYHRAVQKSGLSTSASTSKPPTNSSAYIFPDPLSLRDIGLVHIILSHDNRHDHQDGDQDIDTLDTLLSHRAALSAHHPVQDGEPFVVASDESQARANRQPESKYQC